jgi:hypothetical protein
MNEASWGYVGFAKVPGVPRSLASYVDMVVVKIDFDSGGAVQFYELANGFGISFDGWYAVAIQRRHRLPRSRLLALPTHV